MNDCFISFFLEPPGDEYMAADRLRHVIRQTWWLPLIQGIAAVAIGLLLLTPPAPKLVLLTIFLGLAGSSEDSLTSLVPCCDAGRILIGCLLC
jgi:hypothetical protein